MTEVKTFRAASMQEALDVVRRELGADAVILHTRQVEKKRILPWQKPLQEVEITAGLGVNIRPSVVRQRPASRPQARASATTGAPTRPAAATASNRGAASKRSPAKVVAELSSRPSAADDLVSPPPSLLNPPIEPAVPGGSKQAELLTALRSAMQPAASMKTAPEPDASSDVARKLDTIQRMLEKLDQGGRVGRADEVPAELFHLYTDLIESEVEEDLARELVFRLKQNGTPEQLNDSTAARALLTAMVESELRCSAPISPVRNRRKVVALVGPTGVGKTTTIAKLAANFRLRDGIKMGLVTVDTYRVAAVEQLRTYAEIIDLPMKVVTSPQDMRRALDELIGLDLVLIDTAGRSPRDELKIQELKSLLAEAHVDEVHLVMSLVASVRSIQATAEKFAPVNTTSIILTKLDEAAGMGSLLSVARKVPLPVSYLTTGQDVPDDIEPALAARMSRLILGQDRLYS